MIFQKLYLILFFISIGGTSHNDGVPHHLNLNELIAKSPRRDSEINIIKQSFHFKSRISKEIFSIRWHQFNKASMTCTCSCHGTWSLVTCIWGSKFMTLIGYDWPATKLSTNNLRHYSITPSQQQIPTLVNNSMVTGAWSRKVEGVFLLSCNT